MNLSEGQIHFLIENSSYCVYAKCCAVMFIRLVGKPEEIWARLQDHLFDFNTFQASAGEEISVGEYVERILTNQSYYGVQLPRIPVLIQREISKRVLMLPDRRARFTKILNTEIDKDTLVNVYLEGMEIATQAIFKYKDGRKAHVNCCGRDMHVGLGDVECGGEEIGELGSVGRNLGESLVEKVRIKETIAAIAKNRSEYIKRPVSYKSALSLKMPSGIRRKRSRSRSLSPQRLFVQNAPREMTLEEKKRFEQIKAEYGGQEESNEGEDLTRKLNPQHRHEGDKIGPDFLRIGK